MNPRTFIFALVLLCTISIATATSELSWYDPDNGLLDTGSAGNNLEQAGPNPVNLTTPGMTGTYAFYVAPGQPGFLRNNTPTGIWTGNHNFTTCLWANIISGQIMLTTHHTPASFDDMWFMNNGGNVQIRTDSDGAPTLSPITLLTWTHYCGIYNTTDKTVDISENGQILYSGTLANTPTFGTPSIGLFDNPDLGSSLYGTLDDVRIYDAILNQSEINFLYNSGTGTNLSLSTFGAPPPFMNVSISAVTTDSITNQTARINFTTNIPCNVSILYYNPPNSPNTYFNAAFSTTHSNTISGLTPDSAYEYNLTCENSTTAYQTTGPYSFSTLAQDPPVIHTVNVNTTTGGSGFTQALNQTLDSVIANVTDADTSPAFVTVETTLHRPSGTASFTNQPMTVAAGTIYTFQADTLLNETGLWTLNVTASDGVSSTFELNVLNVTCATNYACNGYNACGITDNQSCNSVTDLNSCGITYTGNYSEFSLQSCNYCTATFSGPNLGNCLNQNQTVTYYYTNTCCATTGLTSDCTIPAANTTQACSAFAYGTSDIVPAAGNLLTQGLLALAGLATLLVALGVGVYASTILKKK